MAQIMLLWGAAKQHTNTKKNDKENTMEVVISGDATATTYMTYDSLKPQLFIDGKEALIKPGKKFIKINNVSAGKHHLMMK